MTQPAPSPPRRLPFSYARRHGVLLLEDPQPACLGFRPGVEPLALAEARRFAGRRLPLRPLSAEEFERLLAGTYQQDANSMQLAEDLGDSLDLAALATEVMEGALPLDPPLEVALKVGTDWETMDRYVSEDGAWRRIPKTAVEVAREEADEEVAEPLSA